MNLVKILGRHVISPRRRTAALLATTTAAGLLFAGGAGLAAAAPRPASTAAVPAPVPGLSVSLGISTAKAMVQAEGKLFIATGDTIQVRSYRGALLHTIVGESGVSDLLVAADGSKLYAADSNGSAISVIDPVSATETAHWSLGTCPSELALSGSRLFVSYGCQSAQDGIGSVDADTGGALVDSGLGAHFYYPPHIAATAGTLLAEVLGISPNTTTSYTVSGSTLTMAHSAELSMGGFVLSPAGDRFVAPASGGNSGLIEYRSDTLAQLASYGTAYGSSYVAAAYSPSTGRLAAGADYGGLHNVDVFDTTSHNMTVASDSHPASSYNTPWIIGNSMLFGPDLKGTADSIVYALAQSPDDQRIYLTESAAAPLSIAHMTLGLSSPAAYGKPLGVAVTFPGHANVALTLKVLPNSGSPIYVPVRTNQWGVATASIKVNFTGRVYAYYGGDLLTRHEAPTASAIHAFTVPTRMAVSMLGAYKTSGGVLYYHSGLNVHLHVLVGPPHERQLSVVLQAFVGGKWVNRPTAIFTTNQWGTVDLYLNNGIGNILYRTLVSTPSSVFNLGSHGTGAVFKLG
jgi:DNA-binding beta-propeller fold protein YncE